MSETVEHVNAAAFDLMPRPALSAKQAVVRNGFRLEPIVGGHIMHVLGKSADGDLMGFLREAVASQPFAVRAVSPGQTFIVGNETLSHAAAQALARKIAARADVIDQSHGRVRMVLQGHRAERALAKGTAVDLAIRAFPVGQSAMTLLGHIGAHITRIGDDCFEIIVLRGFAESLWGDLDQMSREFELN